MGSGCSRVAAGGHGGGTWKVGEGDRESAVWHAAEAAQAVAPLLCLVVSFLHNLEPSKLDFHIFN